MNGHALVVGGGIGGLLAAHALADRCERVTLLERDHYATDSDWQSPPARRGAPQSKCLHLLMAGGSAAVDELMPGWREELIELGATPFDASADAALHVASRWLPRTRSGITVYASSRALLERVLRRGLRRTSTVRVLEGRRVMGLSGDARRVTGVRIAGDDGSDAAIAADLVVDASGSGSTLPAWLNSLPSDSSMVEETVVESGTKYVSRWFHLAPADAPDWHCLSIAPDAGGRGAMMMRAERDHWGVVLVARGAEPMPCDDTGFERFTARLGGGRLHAVLERATPVTAIHPYPSGSSRMRHFDRCAAWPRGLVAIGDAVCALDPYFGLGMTAAARGAVLLRSFLDPPRGFTRPTGEFQQALASQNTWPWLLATGRDPDGQPVPRDEEHIARLYAAAPSSPDIAHALLRVQHLLRPVDSLMELTHK